MAVPDYIHGFVDKAVLMMKKKKIDWRLKEAIMYALSKVRYALWKQKDLRDRMDEILVNHVLPELVSDEPFLRGRACNLIGVYGDVKF